MLDLLSQPVPSFNVRGEESFKTWFGGLLSIAMISAVSVFALLRTSQILKNENVVVTSYVAEDALSIDDVFEFEDSDFMIAFTLTDEVTLAPKNDKRFVKW